MTAPQRRTLAQRYPLQYTLAGAALVIATLACAGLAGIGVATLIATGHFVWPGGPSAILTTIVDVVRHPGDPASAYPYQLQPDLAGPAAMWTGAGIGIVIAGVLVWKLAVAVASHRDPRRHIEKAEKVKVLERDSSSAWGRLANADLAVLVDDGDPLRWPLGTLDGVPIAAPRFESLMVKAPTGSGKTSRYVVPMVLRLCQAQVPKVITSIKMDVQALTLEAARKAGPTYTFSPGRPDSCRWAAFAGCHTAAGARSTAAWMSKSKKADSSGVENMKFWEELGRKLLTPLLFACFRSGKGMTEMMRIVETKAESTVTEMLNKILADATGDDDEAEVRNIFAMWRATCGREERTKSSVFSTAEVILSGFDHPEVRGLIGGNPTDKDVYTPGRLIDTRATLYMTSTKTKVDEYGAVFDAMMAQLLYEVETRSDRNNGLPIPTGLALILEEAANVATPAELGYVASAMRAMGLMLASFWQDDGQIERCFGKATARTVESNHTWKAYLPGTTDAETLKRLSEQIGTYRAVDTSWSHSENAGTGRASGNVSTSARYVDLPAATVRDLESLDRDHAIIIGPSRKALKLTTCPWFNNPALRAHIPADVAQSFDHAFTPAPAPSMSKR